MNAVFARPTLLLFARAPTPGRAKTRLAARVGAEAAAGAHRACVVDAISLADSLPECRRRLLVAGEADQWRRAAIGPGAAWEIEPQRGRDLGERLSRGVADAFRRGAAKVIAIGSDTPWMGARRIRLALAWLDRADVVLGPSADGGYYLVGARRFVPEIFRGIAWGSSAVLNSTRLALDLAGASYRLLDRDFDLDRPADLDRAYRLLRREPWRAPHLAAWLETHGVSNSQ